jgi:hypothetical protein
MRFFKFHLFLSFQILVEFDHLDWEKREWLNVHKDNYHVLLVEESLCLASRQNATFSTSAGSLHPALVNIIFVTK